MPDINDYCMEIQNGFEEASKNGTLSLLLRSPSPKRIRKECLNLIKTRFDPEDRKTLRAFFGECQNLEGFIKRIERHPIDKFKPVQKFLLRQTIRPDDTIQELAAWLLDFKPRPLDCFCKNFQVKHSQEDAKNEGALPKFKTACNSYQGEETREEISINTEAKTTQPENISETSVRNTQQIIEPPTHFFCVKEPNTIEPVILKIGRRMMRVAAIFFCLFVLTTLFKSQQERFTEQVTQLTIPIVPPVTENEPETVKQKAPAKKKSVLKETNKRCQSLTLEGRQCKRNATKGDYCWQHPLN